jgi:hypothetical protein
MKNNAKVLAEKAIAEIREVLSSPEEVVLDSAKGFCYFGRPIAESEMLKYSPSYGQWKALILT